MQEEQRDFGPHLNIFGRVGNSINCRLSKLPKLPRLDVAKSIGALSLAASPVILNSGAQRIFSGISSSSVGETAFGAFEMGISILAFQHGSSATSLGY
jgi:hypothetical protein